MARNGYQYRSLFWPVVLIGVGIMWLLGNLGVLPANGLWILSRFWPLLLVWIGLDILFGHRSPVLGAGLGVLAVVVAVLIVVGGPTWGWGGAFAGGELRTERFTEPAGGVEAAEVRLELSHSPVVLTAGDSSMLVDATIRHRGTVDFSVSGGSQKQVALSYRGSGGIWLGGWGGAAGDEDWEISLGRGIPMDLILDLSSGRTQADLNGLRLQALSVKASSGSVEMALPASGAGSYSVSWRASSGSSRVEVASGAAVDMEVDMSSGSYAVHCGQDVDARIRLRGSSGGFTADVPEGAAVQLDVRDSSSGSVRVPSGMVQVERGRDDEGVWETPGFGAAQHKIYIIVERMSSGDVSIT